MRVDSIAAGVRALMAYEPELLLTGHTGALEVTRPMLDDFLAWARQLEGVFTRLCAVPDRVNEALDPDFVVCFPYLSSVEAGAALGLGVRVTNHAPEAQEASVDLVLPIGWTADRVSASATIGAGAMAELPFLVRIPAGAPDGRRVVLADLVLGDRRYGQRAEALVDVVATA
jgi:hypothetical protein